MVRSDKEVIKVSRPIGIIIPSPFPPNYRVIGNLSVPWPNLHIATGWWLQPL